MADSDYIEQWRRWKAQKEGWPLTVHRNGQWCKKIRGTLHYFGPLDEPDQALQLYLAEREYLLAGIDPPSYHDGITVAELCDKHMADAEDRLAAGKLARWSLKDFRLARRCFAAAGLESKPVECLTPMDFAALQQAIEAAGLALRTQKNAHLSIRTVLNWGEGMGLYKLPHYGPRFTPPTVTEIEAEQEAAGKLRFFDRHLLLEVLRLADAKMQVVVLLGINCAFYPQDSEAITLRHLHLDEPIPYHDFRRVKTLQRRMGALWPETVAAIREYIDRHRKPRNRRERRLLLTQHGRPYSQESSGKSLSTLFDGLIETAGDKVPGASLGSLRHTCATVLDLARDQQIIDLVMGHVAGSTPGSRKQSLQRRIYSQLNLGELDRLKAAAEVVRQWLYHGQIAGVPAGEDEDAQDEPVVLRLFGA
jgi:hypothetical protein